MQRHANYNTKVAMKTVVSIKALQCTAFDKWQARMHSNPSAGLSQMYYSTLISLIFQGTLQFKSFIKSNSDRLPRCD